MAQDLHEVGVRVEELLAELRAEADPAVHERAEALVSLLVEFYGAGLERILALVAREPAGELIVRRLAQDDLLASLFALHGLHPVPVEDRVQEALQGLRPQLGGTRVILIDIDGDGVAHCTLSAGGCGSAPLDLARTTVETAVACREGGHEAEASCMVASVLAAGDPREAEAAAVAFADALAKAEALGMRPIIARCHFGLGQLHQRRGEPVKAGEHLTRAVTLLRALGMRPWLERARAAIGEGR